VSNSTASTVEERDYPWESGDQSVARSGASEGQIMIKQETESEAHEKTFLMSQYYLLAKCRDGTGYLSA
jgi:hypothetical protein